MERRTFFLIALVIGAVALVVSGSFGVRDGWIGGLLLALILPGYALTSVVFPGDTLGSFGRLVISLGLSLAIVALGGLILNLTPWGLNQTTWMVFLGITTVAAIIVAIRYGHLPSTDPAGRPGALLDKRQVLLFSLAALVTISAIGIARTGASRQPAPEYTQLWILPGGGSAPDSIRLGVQNMERTEMKFKLQLRSTENEAVVSFFFDLKPGEKWEPFIPLPPQLADTQIIEGDLYRLDNPEVIYRRATLWRGK